MATIVLFPSDLATATNQGTQITAEQAIQALLVLIEGKTPALVSGSVPVDMGAANVSKETGGNLAAILAKLSGDPATQTTLAAILAKIISAPATEGKQDTGNGSLASILAKLSSDPATQTTLAAVLAKMIAAPATEAKQDTGNGTAASILAKLSADPATQTTLAAVLAKLSSDPATQTTLAAVLAKLSADPATQTTLAAVLAALTTGTVPTSMAALPNNTSVVLDEFDGSVLDSAIWDLISTGSGMTVSLINSMLRIKTGTTAATETILRTKNKYPMESLFKWAIQRNLFLVEQEVILEAFDSAPVQYTGATWTKVTNGVLNFTSVSGSNVITINSGTPVVGAYVAGTNIAASSYIVAVDGALAILNNNCSGAATNNTTLHQHLLIDAGTAHNNKAGGWIEITASSDATMLGYNTSTIGSRFLVTDVPTNSTLIIIPNNGTFAGGAGPGTLSFYSYDSLNIMQWSHDNTSATASRFQVWKDGYSYTTNMVGQGTATSTTTVNPGMIGMMRCNDGVAWMADVTNNNVAGMSLRMARENRVPKGSTQAYFQIRIKHIGAPSSSQYIDFDFLRILQMNELPVFITGRGVAQNAKEAISAAITVMPTATVQNNVSTSTGGVASFGVVNSAAGTNLTSLKGSAGAIGSISLTNTGTTWCYAKLYNKASAPVLASDTPVVIIPLGPGATWPMPYCHYPRFSTGIAYALVSGPTNTDATPVQANQVIGSILYA